MIGGGGGCYGSFDFLAAAFRFPPPFFLTTANTDCTDDREIRYAFKNTAQIDPWKLVLIVVEF